MKELSKVNLWSATKLWPDSTVFIVGGGSSLNTTGLIWSKDTRDEILKSVSDNLSCIHDKRVIGVNNAFELGSWIDILFFGDARWIDWNLNKVLEYSGLTVCNVPVNNGFVKRLERVEQPGIDIRPTHCCWNKSSGGAAINLAVLLGAKTIVLVGFDMDVGGSTGEHNWHKIHKIQNHRTNDLPYKVRFLPPMKAIKERSDQLGIKIINTSMNSKIEEFEKMELSEVVKLC
jgi:hypothetical protein